MYIYFFTCNFSQIHCCFTRFYDYYFVCKMMKKYHNLLKLGSTPESKQPWNLKSNRFGDLQLIIVSSLLIKKKRKINLLAFLFFLSITNLGYPHSSTLKLLFSKTVLIPVCLCQIHHSILCALLTDSSWKKHKNIFLSQEGFSLLSPIVIFFIPLKYFE